VTTAQLVNRAFTRAKRPIFPNRAPSIWIPRHSPEMLNMGVSGTRFLHANGYRALKANGHQNLDDGTGNPGCLPLKNFCGGGISPNLFVSFSGATICASCISVNGGSNSISLTPGSISTADGSYCLTYAGGNRWTKAITSISNPTISEYSGGVCSGSPTTPSQFLDVEVLVSCIAPYQVTASTGNTTSPLSIQGILAQAQGNDNSGFFRGLVGSLTIPMLAICAAGGVPSSVNLSTAGGTVTFTWTC
jgi:hypothetical protein